MYVLPRNCFLISGFCGDDNVGGTFLILVPLSRVHQALLLHA